MKQTKSNKFKNKNVTQNKPIEELKLKKGKNTKNAEGRKKIKKKKNTDCINRCRTQIGTIRYYKKGNIKARET